MRAFSLTVQRLGVDCDPGAAGFRVIVHALLQLHAVQPQIHELPKFTLGDHRLVAQAAVVQIGHALRQFIVLIGGIVHVLIRVFLHHHRELLDTVAEAAMAVVHPHAESEFACLCGHAVQLAVGLDYHAARQCAGSKFESHLVPAVFVAALNHGTVRNVLDRFRDFRGGDGRVAHGTGKGYHHQHRLAGLDGQGAGHVHTVCHIRLPPQTQHGKIGKFPIACRLIRSGEAGQFMVSIQGPVII